MIHTKHNLLISNTLDQIWFWKKYSDYIFTGVYNHILHLTCLRFLNALLLFVSIMTFPLQYCITYIDCLATNKWWWCIYYVRGLTLCIDVIMDDWLHHLFPKWHSTKPQDFTGSHRPFWITWTGNRRGNINHDGQWNLEESISYFVISPVSSSVDYKVIVLWRFLWLVMVSNPLSRTKQH